MLVEIIKAVHKEDNDDSQYTSLLHSLSGGATELTLPVVEVKALHVDTIHLLESCGASEEYVHIREFLYSSLKSGGHYNKRG
jgi:hypothetical protein